MTRTGALAASCLALLVAAQALGQEPVVGPDPETPAEGEAALPADAPLPVEPALPADAREPSDALLPGQPPGERVADAAVLRQALLALCSDAVEARAAALSSLARTGDLRVFPVLRAHALESDPALRSEAILGMGHLPAGRVLPFLSAVLGTPTSRVEERDAAIRALESLGTDAAADVLYDLRAAMDPASNQLASKVLSERFSGRVAYRDALAGGSTDAGQEATGDRELAELLADLHDPALQERRVSAAPALARLGDARSVPPLEMSLSDPDPAIREAACAALGGLVIPESAYALDRCARDQRRPMVLRSACIDALIRHDSLLAALLLLDLGWDVPDGFAGEAKVEAASLIARREPGRYSALSAEGESPGPEVEVELLLDLLQSDSETRRGAGIRRAGEVKADVLPALLAQATKPATRGVLIAALGRYDDGRARAALSDFLASPSVPEDERDAALQGLAAQGSAAFQDLVTAARRIPADTPLQARVRKAVSLIDPARARAAGLYYEEIDRAGVVPVVLAGSVHGAVAMSLLSSAANPSEDKITFLPAFGGAILGAATPYLLTRGEEFTVPQAAWVASGGVWGLYDGALLAYAVGGESSQQEPDDTNRRLGQALALTGQVSGLVATWLTRDLVRDDPGQIAFMNAGVGVGSLGGLGIALQAEAPTTSSIAAWTLIGSTTGLASSAALGPRLTLGAQDYTVILAASGIGAWNGAFLMHALNPDGDSAAGGGALLGGALGYTLGNVMAGFTDVPGNEVGFASASYAMGNVLGTGLLLQTENPEDAEPAGWILVPGAGALAVAAALGPRFQYEGTDGGVQLGAMALGAWTGGWGFDALRPEHETAAGGGVLLGLSTGFAAGSVLAATTDPSVGDATLAFTGFGLGSMWGAGLGLVQPDLRDRWVETLMLSGGWGALAGAVALRDQVAFDGPDQVLAGFGGAWGIYQGLGIRDMAGSGSDRTGYGATLLGFSSGVLSFAALSQVTDVDYDQIGRMATGGFEGSVVGRGLGLLIPGMSSGGVTGAMLSAGWSGLALKGFSVPPAEFTTGDSLAVAAGAGWGAFQAGLIASSMDLDSRHTEGAVTLGLGLGTISGEAFARATNLEATQVLFTQFTGYAGSGLGAGIPMMGDASTDAALATSAVAGWAAQLGVAWFADDLWFRTDDAAEYLFFQGWGLWQGLGFAAEWDSGTEQQRDGVLLTSLSLGFLVPMTVNQVVDYNLRQDLAIGSAAALGTWLGGWWPYAVSGDADGSMLGALLGGDVALAAAALAVSPLLEVRSGALLWTEVFGLAGLAVGSSGTAIFSSDNQTIVMGMSITTTAGLVLGALLAPSLAGDEAGSPGHSYYELASADRGDRKRLRLGNIEVPLLFPGTFVAPPPPGHPDGKPVLLYGVEGVL
jgi:HEAT repeat protein